MVKDSQASRIISCYLQRRGCIKKVSSILREIEGPDFLNNGSVMDRKMLFCCEDWPQSAITALLLFVKKKQAERNGLNMYKSVSQRMELLVLRHHKFKGLLFTSNKVIFKTASASCKFYFLCILWHLYICEKKP